MIDWKNDACDLASEDIIAATGCSPSAAKRWKADYTTMQEAARHCVRYRIRFELSELRGKDWEHFQFHSGRLFVPSWRELLERHNAFYRAQVQLEAKFGLMLGRVFG